MTHLLLLLPLDVVEALGWTLLHFVWQGAVLAAILYTILPMCRSAAARHNWALATLAMMVIVPVMTFLLLQERGNGSPPPLAVPGVAYGMVSGVVAKAATAVAGTVSATTHPVAATAGRLALPSITLPWIDWLVVFWLAGVAVLSLRALGGFYLAENMRRRDTAALPAELLQRCQALQHRLGLTWPVQFLQSCRVQVPLVIGWFRPVILIPISAITGLSPQQLDALILHELAHIRRFDTFTNIALMAVETILFYHPAVWWVGRRVRIEREDCCDDFAVSQCGDAALYVEALTGLATSNAIPVLALAANGGRLKQRVARLLGVSSESGRRSRSAMGGIAFAIAALVAPLSLGLLSSALALAQTQNDMATSRARFAQNLVLRAERLAEQSRPRKAISYDPNLFDKYVGYYRLNPTTVIPVNREANHYFIKLPGQTRMEIHPESQNKFFADWVIAQVSFVSDTDGRVTGLILHEMGLEQPAAKIDEAAASAVAAFAQVEAASRAQRRASNTPNSGTEAYIRHHIEEIQSGQMNFDELGPDLAEVVYQQLPEVYPLVKSWGAIKSMTFTGVGPMGADIYEVDFEKARTEWRILLMPDGTTEALGFGQLPPLSQSSSGGCAPCIPIH